MRCSVPVTRLLSVQVPCAHCSSVCPSCSAVELGLAHSPRSHRSNPSLERLPAVPASPAGPPAPAAELLPHAAAAATPQQARLSLVAAASPVAPANTPASPSLMGQVAAASRSALEQRSQPVPASAVAQAIEAAAAESSGADEASLIRRLSLAEPVVQPAQTTAEEQQPEAEQPADEQPARRTSFFSVAQVAEAAAAESPAAVPAPAEQAAEAAVVPPPSMPAAQAAAASPVPPTPYAATEYDGDDVVMMDVGEPWCFLCWCEGDPPETACSALGRACSKRGFLRSIAQHAYCIRLFVSNSACRLHAVPNHRQAAARRQQPLPAGGPGLSCPPCRASRYAAGSRALACACAS